MMRNISITLVFVIVTAITGCADKYTVGSGTDAYIPVERIIEIRDMFYARNYAELERIVIDLQERAESDPVTEVLMFDVETIFSYRSKDDEDIYNDWVGRNPESWVARMARGIYFVARGWQARGPGFAHVVGESRFAQMEAHFEKARDDLRHALDMKPTLTVAYARLINMAMASSLHEEKTKLLKEALTNVPSTYLVRDRYMISLMPKWGGSWKEMESFADRVYAMREKNPLFARLRGVADYHRASEHSRNGEYEKAIMLLDHAISLDPYWKFYAARASEYRRQGEYEQALADINTAIAKRDGVQDTLNSRADVLMELDRYDEALVDIERAMKLYPRSTAPLERRARLYWHKKDYAAANQDYSAILEREPDNVWARASRGQLNLQHLNNYELASEDLLLAYSAEPKPETWFNYASALYLLKDDRTVMAFATFLTMCSEQTCVPADKTRARQFIECVHGNKACSWKPEFYEYWKAKIAEIPSMKAGQNERN
jgi:tetratricopeptide (TPR) repeat protein